MKEEIIDVDWINLKAIACLEALDILAPTEEEISNMEKQIFGIEWASSCLGTHS